MIKGVLSETDIKGVLSETDIFNDLNTWIRKDTRSGIVLPDTISPGVNDAQIILPHYYKPSASSYCRTSDTSDLEIGNDDFTLCGWVKAESNDKSIMRVLLGKTTGNTGDYSIYMDHTTGYIKCRIIPNPFDIIYMSSTVDFTSMEWYFVRLDINQSTKKIRFFINEEQIGTDTSYVGTFPATGKKFFVGIHTVLINCSKASYSDTYVFHKLLSDAEAMILYQRGSVDGAAAHWTMSEGYDGSGAKFFDVSGNNIHLDIVNDAVGKRAFSIYGSRYPLDNGYTLYYDELDLDNYIYVPLDMNGSQIMGDDIFANTFHKLKEYSGSLSNHNLANSYIIFAGDNWDRSNTSLYTALARGSDYDVSDPKKWHITKLNQLHIHSWLMSDYRDINFVKGSTNTQDDYNYLTEIISYNTVKAGDIRENVLRYTNDSPCPKTFIDITCNQDDANQVEITLTSGLGLYHFIDWGDGNIEQFTGIGTVATSSYSETGTFNIKIYKDINKIKRFSVYEDKLSGSIEDFVNTYLTENIYIREGEWVGSVENLPSTLTHLVLIDCGAIIGTLGNLSISCPFIISLTLSNTACTGSFENLPNVLESLSLHGELASPVNFYGDIANLPTALKDLSLSYIVQNNVIGHSDNLPANLETFNMQGECYDVDGDIDNLPASLIQFCVNGHGGTWIGSVNSFVNPSFYYLSFANMPNLTGIIENIVATAEVIYLNATAGGIIYNGGNVPAWDLTGLHINCDWNSAMIDAFLINAAANLPVTANNPDLWIIGTRTGASDAAIATLITNGYDARVVLVYPDSE